MTLTGLQRFFGLSALLGAAALMAGCNIADPNPSERVFPAAGAVGAPTGGPLVGNTNAFGTDGFAFLRVGDMIMITFADVPPTMREQQVRIPDSGTITLPYNVRVQATGKTTSQLEKDIRDAYVPKLFVNLTAIVTIDKDRSFIVDGEVRKPGQQPYVGEMNVLRAIGAAGGFTEFANRRKIQLRRPNGQKFILNYNKVIDKPELDMPVYPNDHIIVGKSIFP
jgi:protein involved in polysaccharide export with SLBB domain